MANLAFRAFTQAVDQTFAVSSINITAPTGTVQNDLGLIFFFTGVAAPTGAPTHTTPSGWTLIRSDTFTLISGGFNCRESIYYRIEGATPQTETMQASGNCAITCTRLSYDNPNTVTPFDTSSFNSGTGTAVTFTGITVANANSLLVGYGISDAASVTFTPDADFTERSDANGAMSMDAIFPNGASGNQTATASGSGGWTAWLMSFRSEPAGGPLLSGVRNMIVRAA